MEVNTMMDYKYYVEGTDRLREECEID